MGLIMSGMGEEVYTFETEMAALYEIDERQLGSRCGGYSSRSFTAGFFAQAIMHTDSEMERNVK